jgi:hypothetical protein
MDGCAKTAERVGRSSTQPRATSRFVPLPLAPIGFGFDAHTRNFAVELPFVIASAAAKRECNAFCLVRNTKRYTGVLRTGRAALRKAQICHRAGVYYNFRANCSAAVGRFVGCTASELRWAPPMSSIEVLTQRTPFDRRLNIVSTSANQPGIAS